MKRLNRGLGLGLLLIAGPAHAEDIRGYGEGIGIGIVRATVDGNFMRDQSLTGLRIGVGAENDAGFTYADGTVGFWDGSCDDLAGEITFAAGVGVRWAKIGIGAINRQARGCGASGATLAKYDILCFPAYGRVHLLITEQAMVTVDGYYAFGCDDAGSRLELPGSGSVSLDPKSKGGLRGYRAAVRLQSGAKAERGIQVEYRVNEGRFDDTAGIGSIDFKTRFAIISYQFLF